MKAHYPVMIEVEVEYLAEVREKVARFLELNGFTVSLGADEIFARKDSK